MNIRNRTELVIMRIVRWAMIAESYKGQVDTSKIDAFIAIREQRVKVDRLKRNLAKAYDPFWRRELADARNELYRMEREARGDEL